MKISFGLPRDTNQDNVWPRNGYGYATKMIMNSLTRMGYDWQVNDLDADVEFWFDQPIHWKPNPNAYVVGYHPWESTKLLDGWSDIMNQCDEIWTPSPVVADWYQRYAGITRPVYVFEHGVDPVWEEVSRKKEDKLSFLHVGGEGVRKGMKETLDSFRATFPTQPDVELNLKMNTQGWNHSGWHRVNILPDSLDIHELVKLFQNNHVYVYPSWGEGFGLTPLQALATGMPTITLDSWAPYAKFLDINLVVESELSDPPKEHINYNLWKALHPGKMWKPNLDSLKNAMRFAYDNYDDCVAYALSRTDEIKEYYDWDRLTDEAFKNLESRLENS